MLLRRQFLLGAAAGLAAAPAILANRTLTKKERVDRALAGNSVDRPPFSFWHHFNLHDPEAHAKATLDFHRDYKTDIVKVMSDFPYPRSAGKWYELKVEQNPFAPQIKALELIRAGLNGQAYYVETIFNSWTVAEKLSSPAEVRRLKDENPAALLSALDVITQSQIHHARRALAGGASGILLAVANPNRRSLTPADYAKFSAPFDAKILEATSGARLNILHLHAEQEYLDQFVHFKAPVLNYSLHVSGIPFAEARSKFSSVLFGGIDEVHYANLTAEELKAQWLAAASAAGNKFFLAPGCSVPNNSTRAQLIRLPELVGA
jgi:uroporphyrinogen decarboxylase